jgi:hypothetical protein
MFLGKMKCWKIQAFLRTTGPHPEPGDSIPHLPTLTYARPDLLSGLFPKCFPTRTLYPFLFSLMSATCPSTPYYSSNNIRQDCKRNNDIHRQIRICRLERFPVREVTCDITISLCSPNQRYLMKSGYCI